MSFTGSVEGGETPLTGSRAPTPKPTPGREPGEFSRLLPIDEGMVDGQYNGPSSYGSVTHASGSRRNGASERGRERDGSLSPHNGSYAESPTRI